MQAAKRILVTGASGLLGRALCAELSHTHEVIRSSRRATNSAAAADLSDEASVVRLIRETNPHLIVNSAAFADVDGCELDPKRAYEANALSAKHLASSCAAAGIPWVQISTDYVFDGRADRPYRETDPTAPVNIYGLTKLAGEVFALSGSADCAVVRTSWLFGAGAPTSFVNAVLCRLKTEKVVSVLDDQMDAPTSVKDLSRAVGRITERMLEQPGSFGRKVYHVCNTGGATRLEMARWMRECLGQGARVERTDRSKIPNRVALRPPYAVMSNEAFVRDFGLPMRSWKESLKEFVRSEEVPCGS